MAVSAARKSGYQVDEKTAAQQVKANVFGLEKLRDYLHQGFFAPVEDDFGPFLLGYILVGLDAEQYKPDLNTDAVAMYLKSHQAVDGQWAFPVADTRPPLCSVYIGQTALAMRALQLYAPQTDKAAYDQSIQLSAGWLAKARPTNNDESRVAAARVGMGCQGQRCDAECYAGVAGDADWPTAGGPISIPWRAAPTRRERLWLRCGLRDCAYPMPPMSARSDSC
jgi:hypothetical protein